jgi:hypothetical protein
MANKRVSKHITNPKDKEYIISLTEKDLCTTKVIMELFGDLDGNDKPRFHPYDTIDMPAGVFKLADGYNKKPFTTTVGIWVFNRVFIENDLVHIFGYINEEINGGKFKWMLQEMGYAILEDDYDVDKYDRFVTKTQFYMPLVSILSPGFSDDLLTINNTIEKKKIELIDKYKDRLVAGDAEVTEVIEKELLAYCKELLKDDPSSDIFNSGARADWDNNFKNMFISKGAVKDTDPNGGYNIIMSSYMDGIKKEEYVDLANALVAGPYSRAGKTKVGGYWEKLFMSATQDVILDEKGSDCGTKRTIQITLDKSLINDMMYSYVVENGRLIELTRKNRDQYLNKTVKMRYSSMCESKTGICNKCFGNLPYRLYTDSVNEKSLKNIGCATPQYASRIKNINMKAFHDSLVTFTEMDPMKAFGVE